MGILLLMSKIDLETAEIVAKNLRTLMNHYDLTEHGVESGAGVEVHTIVKILDCKTNVAIRTAKKISVFFGITLDLLFSSKPLKLSKLENTPTVKKFYEENRLNKKYFESRKKENIVADFLRNILVLDPEFNHYNRAGAITEYINKTYSKSFKAKTVAKELSRLFKEGLVERTDRTGEGSVYYYRRKSTPTKA